MGLDTDTPRIRGVVLCSGNGVTVAWDEDHLSLDVYVDGDRAGQIGFGGLTMGVMLSRSKMLDSLRKAAEENER